MDTQILEMATLEKLEVEKLEREKLESDKTRQQFDNVPYPNLPLEKSPQDDPALLYVHDLTTAYYRHHRRVIDTAGKLILDAGCGTGYKALALAQANPGAKIVGIDLSEVSVNLARERLKHYGFDNTEFYPMAVEALPDLGLEFDYINCDEVLYLLPNPVAGLQAMKAVLKPDGLIRANLHHGMQRRFFHNAQILFKGLGLMERSPQTEEHQAAIELLESLKDGVALKTQTWGVKRDDYHEKVGILSSNHLMLNDKMFTIADMLTILAQADLEFVSMLAWQQWDVSNLFTKVPSLLQQRLQVASVAEKLRIFELINPVHRLMDFWCAHPGQQPEIPSSSWTDADWRSTLVYLHPQLKVESLRSELVAAASTGKPFTLSSRISLPAPFPVVLEAAFASVLIPLWEAPQPMSALVQRFHKVRPVHPVTLEPISEELAWQTMQKFLMYLERFLYVLLQRSSQA